MPTVRRLAFLLLGFCAVVHCTGRAVPTKRGVGDLLGGGPEPPAQAPPPAAPQQQPAGQPQQRPEQHLEEHPLQDHPGEQHPTETETETKADQAGLLGKIIEQHTTTTTTSSASTMTSSATTTHATTTTKPAHTAAEPTSDPVPPSSSTSPSTSPPTPTSGFLSDQSPHKPGVDWHVAAIASIVVTTVGLAILSALFWDTWTRLAGDICCGRRRRRVKQDTDGEELVPDWTRGSWGYSLKGTIGGGFPVFNTPPIGHNFAGMGSGSGNAGGRAAFVAAEEVVGSPPLQPLPPRMPRMRSPGMPTRDWTYNTNAGLNIAGLGIGAPGLARSRSAATRARSDSDGRALPNPHGEDPFATPKQEDYKPPGKNEVKEKNEDAYGGML